MKYRLIIISFFVSATLYSQDCFNVILEDTISHITSSVAESNGFYYVLSGTGSESGIRSFSLTQLNQIGEIQWKNIIANDTLELWEGWEHNLKKTNFGFFIAGSAIKDNSVYRGFHFTNFDQYLNLTSQEIIMYDTIWQKCFNSLKTDDGDVYITGQYYDDTLESSYLYLMKFNPSNEFIWKRAYTDSYSSGSQLLECMNEDIICSGSQSSNGYSDWLINRYTNQGDLLWSKEFGWLGSRNDGAVSALQETPDSCILACGSYPGIKAMVDTYYDGCIRKIDKEGELVWENHYRNYSLYRSSGRVITSFSISGINTLKDGDLIACGSSLSFYPKDRGILMKLNPDGKIKWHKYYYADTLISTWQYIKTFIKTSDNGYLLGGYGNDYTNIGYYPPQQRWLIKTDSLGMDGLCNTEPDALEVDIDLPEQMCAFDTLEVYAYIAGPTAPYTLNISNGQQIDSIYYPPVFVPVEIGPGTIEIKYDATTVMEFEEPVVTLSNHEWGECIAIPIEYYVGNQMGSQNINITVTDGWGNSKTITKPVYVKTCPDGISDGSFNPLQIYPNPASDVLCIEFAGNNRSLPARIYNLEGKEVMTSRFANRKTTIDISELPAGIYRIVIGSFGKSFSVVR